MDIFVGEERKTDLKGFTEKKIEAIVIEGFLLSHIQNSEDINKKIGCRGALVVGLYCPV